jgi:hypothetical protein
MFLKYQKLMTSEKLLYNSILIIIILAIVDYIIIDNHPYPLENFDDSKDDDFEDKLDIESIINTIDESLDFDDDDYVNTNVNTHVNGLQTNTSRYGNNTYSSTNGQF